MGWDPGTVERLDEDDRASAQRSSESGGRSRPKGATRWIGPPAGRTHTPLQLHKRTTPTEDPRGQGQVAPFNESKGFFTQMDSVSLQSNEVLYSALSSQKTRTKSAFFDLTR